MACRYEERGAKKCLKFHEIFLPNHTLRLGVNHLHFMDIAVSIAGQIMDEVGRLVLDLR